MVKPLNPAGNALPGDTQANTNRAAQFKVKEFDLSKPEDLKPQPQPQTRRRRPRRRRRSNATVRARNAGPVLQPHYLPTPWLFSPRSP